MKPTVQFAGEVQSGEDFFAGCGQTAAALSGRGIGPGAVVALMLRNEPVLLELMLAARWLGARWCPVNWHLRAGELDFILRDSAASVLVIHADLLAQVEGGIPAGVQVFVVAPHPHTRAAYRLDDAACTATGGHRAWSEVRSAAGAAPPAHASPGSPLVYTSGTTGRPKGILRQPATPAQQQALARAVAAVLGIEPGMRALVSAPLYHSAPANYVLQAALNDAHIVIEPRFDAARTLAQVESERISHLYLVPTMYARLLGLDQATRQRHDLGTVRFVAATGSACPPEIKGRMIDWWGPVIHEGYAASELGWVTHIDSTEALRKPGSAGRALPGVQLAVLDDAGRVLPAGAVGLVHARSDAVPDFSYAHDDAARQRLERDGLWTLGDLGFIDEEGYLFIVDRQSDMVISGGVNIYPAEIEAVLLTMPGVADAAVFGIPDDEFGEALAAAVQPDREGGLDAAAVQQFVRARLAGYKVPRRVDFHAELPREDSGKIFKRRLREPFWQGRARRV